VPKSLRPVLAFRGLLQPFVEWQIRRRGIEDVLRAAEQEETELTTPQPGQPTRAAAR